MIIPITKLAVHLPPKVSSSSLATFVYIPDTDSKQISGGYGHSLNKRKKNCWKDRQTCAQSKHPTGNLSCNPLARSLILVFAHCPKRSSTNGATDFVAPPQLGNIIMPGAAASSSTPRK